MRCAKMAELIEVPFGLWARMGSRNHVLAGDPDFQQDCAILRGKGMPQHARQHSDVSCAKTAEPVKMPFGLWTRMGPRKHVLDGGPDPHVKEQFLRKGHA